MLIAISACWWFGVPCFVGAVGEVVTSCRPFRQGQVVVQRQGSWQVGDNNCVDDEKRLRTHVVFLPIISTLAK